MKEKSLPKVTPSELDNVGLTPRGNILGVPKKVGVYVQKRHFQLGSE